MNNNYFKKLASLLFQKYIFIIVAAVIMSLCLLYFMSVLIFTNSSTKITPSQDLSINFLLNSSFDELKLRSRYVPKPPKKKQAEPATPRLKIQNTELQKPRLLNQLPPLKLSKAFSSDPSGAKVAAQGSGDSEVSPLFRIQPIYPRKAALHSIEGFVILQFDITKTGQVNNISVLQASPPQIFNSNAVQALQKWKYKAKIKNGQAVRQKNLKVQLDFKLSKD